MQKGKFQPLQKGSKALQKAKRHTFAKRYSKPCKRQSLAKGKPLEKGRGKPCKRQTLAKDTLAKGSASHPLQKETLAKGLLACTALAKGTPLQKGRSYQKQPGSSPCKRTILEKGLLPHPLQRVAGRDLAKGPAKCSSS